MKKLRELLPAPGWALKLLSRNPADKTWICSHCGEISPIALAEGWYARRMCSCERAADEAQQVQQLREELKQARTASTYTWLGRTRSDRTLSEKTFANFRRERQPSAFERARAFAACPSGILSLYGSYGTGKTHLLAAIANTRNATGQACLFASVVSLFDSIGERIERSEDYHELLRRAIQTPLLLLDDIDKLKPSDFREETLYKLINGRGNADLPFALTSNFAPHELGRWIGNAGCSRLMVGLIAVPMVGSDFRLEI